MTIREAAEQAGVSCQAIYKRLKSRGISPESIRDRGTHNLTRQGEELIKDLFPEIEESEESAARSSPLSADHELERLKTEVEELKQENEKLKTKVSTAEARAQALQDERDYLRGALDKSQQLQAMTAQKIPNPPPAITDGKERPWRGLWARITGRRE